MASRHQICVGDVTVGGGAPVRVQSMTSTPTGDADATLAQIARLSDVGCEIVRVALPSAGDEAGFARIVKESPLPVIADIHYDWRLALATLEAGAAGVRINPGTIGDSQRVREIAEVATERGAAIRIGVNQGSLPRALRPLAEREPAKALVQAARQYVDELHAWGCTELKVSVKSSSVPVTIAAYRALAEVCDAPLHVGVTEAGTRWSGAIKSAVGIGTLLAEGIGDTIRVSLTADPVEEVRVAWAILSALGLRRRGPELISCPTCGRTEIDVVSLAEEVERRLHTDPRFAELPITVAVMGCRVNGPEEARHADFGIAGGSGEGVVFVRGERVAKVPEDWLVEELFARMESLRDR
ncbi:MAG: flavodoxin-dependent (E)-4-hydroxy-3-methylbut-2-enyl-diphosphate synthase [Actinobacteria bacterium]|nr:flavodoxin-dependent (E)-4-hydroxy-3-methylbut-2-enyl-diphosphate synthase [Actinomycetota bacterium]